MPIRSEEKSAFKSLPASCLERFQKIPPESRILRLPSRDFLLFSTPYELIQRRNWSGRSRFSAAIALGASASQGDFLSSKSVV